VKEKFLVVYEHGEGNYSGFAPDVPGCISTGKTLPMMRRMMKGALEAHLLFMASDGDPIPQPVTNNVSFSPEDDPYGEVDHYVVEWLEIEVPASKQVVALEAMTA
jgi:predicted RNase H-like HicB family nuclease